MDEISDMELNSMDQAIHQLLKKYKLFRYDLKALFPEGVTSTELDIIKIVSRRPDIYIKEISDELEIAGSTLTSAIDRLEQRELVKRIISSRNRKSLGLKLTDKAEKINIIHEKAEKQIWTQILSKLDIKEEREMFIRLLSKISE